MEIERRGDRDMLERLFAKDVVVKNWAWFPQYVDEAEAMLNDMADRGYRLFRLDGKKVSFRKLQEGEPAQRYCVTLYQGEDEKDQAAYQNLCSESGWQFLGRGNEMNVFESRAEAGAVPLETDDAADFQVMKVAIRKNNPWIVMVVLLLAALLILGCIYWKMGIFDTDMPRYVLTVAFVLLGMIFCGACAWIIRMDLVRMEDALERGDSMWEVRRGPKSYKAVTWAANACWVFYLLAGLIIPAAERVDETGDIEHFPAKVVVLVLLALLCFFLTADTRNVGMVFEEEKGEQVRMGINLAAVLILGVFGFVLL